ncbi:MAG: ParA family partition ATPase [Rhodothermales bacterium]
MSHVIAVLNTKGGAGKSTLATNLARAFQRDGRSVLIVDSDPQGTARDWRETGGDIDLPAVFGVDRPTLDIDIPKVAHAFDVIVIDGAAKMTKMAVSAIKAADLVLIPVQPSAADLWAVNDLVDMIEARQQLTDGRPRAAFVINRQILGTRLAGGVDEVLASYGVPVLESRTSQRVAYSEAMAAGLTVLDYEPDGKAADEIRSLYNELKGYLDG